MGHPPDRATAGWTGAPRSGEARLANACLGASAGIGAAVPLVLLLHCCQAGAGALAVHRGLLRTQASVAVARGPSSARATVALAQSIGLPASAAIADCTPGGQQRAGAGSC